VLPALHDTILRHLERHLDVDDSHLIAGVGKLPSKLHRFVGIAEHCINDKPDFRVISRVLPYSGGVSRHIRHFCHT